MSTAFMSHQVEEMNIREELAVILEPSQEQTETSEQINH